MDVAESLWLLIKYSFLGLFQGITEPLPISSSGHIVILRNLFTIPSSGLLFEIMVNSGSLIAVLIVYRRDILHLSKQFFRYVFLKNGQAKQDFHYVLLLITATIPTGLLGLLFEDVIQNQLSTVKVVSIMLIVTGFALWMIRHLHGTKQDHAITLKDALIVGLAQAVSLIPGISRSGATLTAAMLTGMTRETALRFSFLLYIPVSFGVTVMSTDDLFTHLNFNRLLIPHVLAFLAAIIGSYFALKWFIAIIRSGKLIYFAIYCFIVGIIALQFFAH